MIFKKKEETSLITKQEKYNLTENVKVADIKQYLQDEYNRAYERETTIEKLENRIKILEETEIKYQAMLVVSDETRNRLIKTEQNETELKDQIYNLKEDIKALKNTNTNIELNANKLLKEKDLEIKKINRELKRLAPRNKKEGK